MQCVSFVGAPTSTVDPTVMLLVIERVGRRIVLEQLDERPRCVAHPVSGFLVGHHAAAFAKGGRQLPESHGAVVYNGHESRDADNAGDCQPVHGRYGRSC